jgi:multicomponent K+:H+ antiporter subunit D
MADMAQKLTQVPPSDRGLLHAGAAILAVAFLAKAAIWPLNFWLPAAYAAASTPVAALFAILTKVGVYAILRLWTLCFPATAGASALFGNDALVWGGVLTLGMGAVGMMASQKLGRLAAFSVLASSGTVIAAIGFDDQALTAGALFYMASSTLAACALFLLVELTDRARQSEVDAPSPVPVQRHLPKFVEGEPPQDVNLDDEEVALIGRAIPRSVAFLGLAFMLCTLVVAGLPPLSGFVGKLAMLSALLTMPTSPLAPPFASLVLFALLLASGLLAAMALTRVGIRHFWSPSELQPPRVRLFESLPIALLLGACVLMVVAGEPALRYMKATAGALHEPGRYIAAVTAARTRGPAPKAPEVARGAMP